MGKRGNSGKTKRKAGKIALLVLLALLCIGGVELLFCRVFDPDAYARIMAPVAGAFDSVSTAVINFSASVSRSWNDFSDKLEETYSDRFFRPGGTAAASQLISDPAISGGLGQSHPDVTRFKYGDGREILTGGGVETVYFNQTDPAWASDPFGSDNIGGYGCGPVAMAIVVDTMTNTYTDPRQMSQWAAENGYWAQGSGSYHSIVQGTAEAYGLHAEALSERTPECVLRELSEGNMLVALMGAGHFTNGGHFIVLRSVISSEDSGNKILVADPSSRHRSLVPWDPQTILDELSTSTDNGAPIWVISRVNHAEL